MPLFIAASLYVAHILFRESGSALYRSRTVPRWSATLVIAGSSLVLAFAGTENWMALGSLATVIGMLPLTVKTLHESR